MLRLSKRKMKDCFEIESMEYLELKDDATGAYIIIENPTMCKIYVRNIL